MQLWSLGEPENFISRKVSYNVVGCMQDTFARATQPPGQARARR